METVTLDKVLAIGSLLLLLILGPGGGIYLIKTVVTEYLQDRRKSKQD